MYRNVNFAQVLEIASNRDSIFKKLNKNLIN